MRAIRGEECVGTVVVLDEDVTPFKRVWCVLEAWVSLEQRVAQGSGEGFSYDFLAWDVWGPAALLDAGAGQAPREAGKRLATFPGKVAEEGMRITIEKADAMKEEDKEQILKQVRATDGGCEGLDRKVRAWFVAPAALEFAKIGDEAALEGVADRGGDGCQCLWQDSGPGRGGERLRGAPGAPRRTRRSRTTRASPRSGHLGRPCGRPHASASVARASPPLVGEAPVHAAGAPMHAAGALGARLGGPGRGDPGSRSAGPEPRRPGRALRGPSAGAERLRDTRAFFRKCLCVFSHPRHRRPRAFLEKARHTMAKFGRFLSNVVKFRRIPSNFGRI